MADAPFDWCSFFALFWNDKGLRCKINIPDTLLFRYGQLSAWWATNKEGFVQRHASHNTTLESVRRRFLQVANEDDANYSKFVVICRSGNGQAQLLRQQAFNQLAELLSDRLEAGRSNLEPEVETPQVLQAFIQPHNDLRYVSTYINQGPTAVTCHTFQRKFSRRYTAQPMQGAQADATLDALAAASAGMDETIDPASGQGAVDPTLKMEFRRLTSTLVKYIERAHNLTLAGFVCEWIRDASGKVYLLSVLRTEWASNGSGHGGGSLASANLTQDAEELPEPPAAGAEARFSESDAFNDLSIAPPPPRGPGSWAPSEPPGDFGYSQPASARTNGMADVGQPTPSPASFGGAGTATGWGSSTAHADTPPHHVRRSTSLSRLGRQASAVGGGGLSSATAGAWSETSPPQMPLRSPSPGPGRPTSPSAAVTRPTSAAYSSATSPGPVTVGANATITPKSNLAQFPGGGRTGSLSVAVGNSWPSHQHEAQLGSPAGAGPSGLVQQPPTSPTSGYRQHHHGILASSSVSQSMSMGMANGWVGSSGGGAATTTTTSFSAAGQQAANANMRPLSARPCAHTLPPAPSPMADRQGNGNGVAAPNQPRPGSSPVGFGRSVGPGPGRPTSALTNAPAITYVPPPGPAPTSPPRAAPQPLLQQPGRPVSPSGRMMAPALSPTRSRPGTGHVNSGPRGTPVMVQQLAKELEAAREQLLFQNQMAEANAAKVRQLEREKELLISTFDQRVSELRGSLLVTQQDLAASRAECDQLRRRASDSESRASYLESRSHSLQSTLDAERGTVMTALRECHERDSSTSQRAEQLETEVLRLTERLKEEATAVNALKRQLLQFSDIAERYKTTLREGEFENGMQEVLDKVAKLFEGQTNPFGEQYAVQKVLHHYNTELRAVFLYYAQLENNFTAYWPPGLAFAQWMLFCKETETSDPRSNSRFSAATNPHKMLHPRDCEAVFRTYGKLDTNAINTTAPVLTYESFLAAVTDLSFRVKRPDNPYLSEAIREYILKYISRANKMSPNGLRRGQKGLKCVPAGRRAGCTSAAQVRDALEGVQHHEAGQQAVYGAQQHHQAARGGPTGPSAGPVVARSASTKKTKKGLAERVRSTTGTLAGGSLAASRPGSAVGSRAHSVAGVGTIEQDLAMAAGRLVA